jgi:aspartyl-tRNA(Asn)/glutamyl-tRNA(Gln) amidotransferase subunit C
MVELSKEELVKLAKMSGLSLTEQELVELRGQLKMLLEYTDEIMALSLGEEVEATRSINVFREDKVKVRDSEAIVANSPNNNGSYFVVPKILH